MYFSEESATEIQLGKDLNVHTDLRIKSLMSEGFLQGESTDAYNIQCSLDPDTYDVPRNLTILVNELAPFTDSEGYCMYIDGDQEPKACSGTGLFQSFRETFVSETGWKFEIHLNDSVEYVPRVRFWISISSKSFLFPYIILKFCIKFPCQLLSYIYEFVIVLNTSLISIFLILVNKYK